MGIVHLRFRIKFFCVHRTLDKRSIIFVYLSRSIVERKKVATKQNSDGELTINEEG